MAPMPATNLLTLPDKRQLTYAEYGDPNRHPVLYFHGGISCWLEPLLWGNETIRRLGLRLIAPDRPGVGQSDFQSNRSFSDWLKDIEFLSAVLNLDRFSVLGISGGGGYAIACAAKIPARLHTTVIASGAWQANAIKYYPKATRFAWMLARKFHLLNLLTLKLEQQSFKKSSEKFNTEISHL